MDAEQARKIVNGAGYLLQIGVAHRVRQMRSHPSWEVVVVEHPWQRGDEARFIDLILASGEVVRLVVECKRPGGGEYTFLVPQDAGPAKTARCRWVEYDPKQAAGPVLEQGWYDFGSTANTYESAYAILQGKENGRTPILERLAAEAVEACDAVAQEELNLAQQRGRSLRRIYVPTIITTAPPYIVRCNPEEIDPATATLTGDIEPQLVDFLWFRKSLTTALSANAKPEDLKAANADRDRSVLILGAANLEASLRATNLVGDPRCGR